jgi:hypothetical protein
VPFQNLVGLTTHADPFQTLVGLTAQDVPFQTLRLPADVVVVVPQNHCFHTGFVTVTLPNRVLACQSVLDRNGA